MPMGLPRWLRCYDNGGPDAKDGSIDRFTVVFSGRYTHKTGGAHWYLGMSPLPFHPQGFGQHGEHNQCVDAMDGAWAPAVGRKCHLGLRIQFEDLPQDCQICALNTYCDLWDLDRTKFAPHNEKISVSVLTP